MSIAITDDHRTLARTVSDFLVKNGARGAARNLLEADSEGLPAFWADVAGLGWLGLHIPEEYGGSGFGLPELVIVVEELGRAVAPGPFVPTVAASAVIAATASADVKARLLPGLVDGSSVGTVALSGAVGIRDGVAQGSAGVVLSGALADVVLVLAGEDVAIVDPSAPGVNVEVPANLDPTRRSARMTLEGAAVELIPGAGQVLVDLSRLLLAAEATGIARECTVQASDYAKVRQQFGRPIATFQAVKHHCANMAVAAELATAAVWDAARAADIRGDQLTYTAALAATLAVPAADHNAQLNIQVHGGIGFTWEHDAHLYLRRATAIEALIDAEQAAIDLTDLVRRGVARVRSIDLPPEAEPIRESVRAFVEDVRDLDGDARRQALIESGYVMPNWPKPWGRDAGAIEQLVVEQEFAAASIKRPGYGITGWVILTLVQHATDDQVARWVRPALNQEVIWCQLFSEPDAGSDAAGVKTKAIRVDGGWLINGQKVWTSGAHVASFGLATVRTNPDAPKHQGITTVVVDMKADGVTVRPLRMVTGNAEFNEVFFDDVFVPDDDVVGNVDSGWTVARATLGNESVSIGGGQGGMSLPVEAFIAPLDAHPERLPGGAGRVGRAIASSQAMDVLNLRSAHRAVAGGDPGAEGNVTKLVLSENGHEAAAILNALSGPDGAFLDGPAAISGIMVLMHRAMSIAGGTSEIKRNQIGERILGLPRDPLIN
ncbi:MAG TPA: acyl-CoA dehydrogenase [Acidimicrobiales bacterium]|jgi:alkylation response protein AidB-like acyl-CoA dehydrogenase